MGSSQGLYNQLYETLRAYHPAERVNRIQMWVWVIVGLLQSRSVHLSGIALMLPSAAQAAGRIMQVRRWLANRHLAVRPLYDPLIREVVRPWRGRDLSVILDGTTTSRGRLQVVQCSLSHCYRALPLAWQVVAHTGCVSVATAGELLRYVATLVGQRRRVTFLADRGFRDCEWADLCRTLNWNYIIRVANSTTVYFADGRHYPIHQLAPKAGGCRYLPQVCLTHQRWPCHLALTWTRDGQLCALMTNLAPSKWVLTHYIRRMHIEQAFRDLKSGSFDLAASRLRDPQRLNALLLAVAIATLWLFHLGEGLLRADQRRQIDPGHHRQLSVFQLGWRVLQRALACFQPPPFSLVLRPFRLAPIERPNC